MKDIMEYIKENSNDQVQPLTTDSQMTLCAVENNYCECQPGNTIHYGVAVNGTLDQSQGSASIVTRNPMTFCSNAIFGDPHFGVVK